MKHNPNPIAAVEWIDPSTLKSNNYNPNRVFGPEFALLKTSLLADGWTQPIVVTEDDEIVDGFHRWTLASTDKEVAMLGGGLVPVVRLRNKSVSARMASTVRHNRARGQHGILKMGNIVREIIGAHGETNAKSMLGMEPEELNRLAETRSSPELIGKDAFNKGWIPDAATPNFRKGVKKSDKGS